MNNVTDINNVTRKDMEEFSPEGHLFCAAAALAEAENARDSCDRRGSFAALASAHLLAAQVKTQHWAGIPEESTPWGQRSWKR